MSIDRSAFDEAIANMSMASSPYYKEYVFYLHLLAQCRVTFNTLLKAPAGVNFVNDHYNLHINPSPVIGYSQNENGEMEPIIGFCSDMPLEHRIGILKHEMLHVALGHLLRVGDKDFMKYNVASDTALNQEITREHLPEYALYPDNFPNKEVQPLWGETAEYYYELLEDMEEQEDGEGGNGFGGQPLDDHDLWMGNEGDPTLQQELTKNMVEKAGNEAIKSAGRLPSNYANMLDNLTIRREVDWKRVLRTIVGNKRANRKKTLLRRDRRMPFANWLKGRTKDRVFELAVVSDVSGSVSEDALKQVWGEIISICEMFNTPVTMVQVDTEPSPPEKLTKDSKAINRTRCGGTILAPAIEEFRKNNIDFDALVVTTDGYLFEEDIQPFAKTGKPVIWLIESTGNIMAEMNQGKMRAIKLTGT